MWCRSTSASRSRGLSCIKTRLMSGEYALVGDSLQGVPKVRFDRELPLGSSGSIPQGALYEMHSMDVAARDSYGLRVGRDSGDRSRPDPGCERGAPKR